MAIRQNLRALYQTAVRQRWREDLWRLRRDPAKWLHNLRWRLMSRQRVAGWLEKRLPPDQTCWLFIVGCNNSGTSLLDEVLGTHQSIRTLPEEGQHLTRALPHPTRLGVGRMFTLRRELFRWTEHSDPEPDFGPAQRVMYDWALYFPPERFPSDKKVVGQVLLEKSPTNTLRSRWLERHFRPSRFLVLLRHPYAVCEGIRRRKGRSIEEAARHWACVHQILDEDLPHLEHVLVIKYEEFCADLMDVLRRVEQFLDLETPFAGDLLHKPFATHNVFSAAREVADLNAGSIERLSPSDVDTINRIAGEAMQRFGYATL